MSVASSTIYVDVNDDNSVGNFTKIQDAINASEPNDLIVVLNGTYPENLMVDKSIILKGENGPIVNGSGLLDPLITITSDNVTLEGFNFSRGRSSGFNSGAVLVLADGCKILNNTISSSSSHGLCLLNSENHLVTGNSIHNNQYAGVWLLLVNFSQVSGNQFFENGKGGIHIESSRSNSVIRNIFCGNGEVGAHVVNSVGNEINVNKISSNSEDGIYLFNSSDNVVVGNEVHDNDFNGVNLQGSGRNYIFSNVIQNCGDSGILCAASSNDNVITRNVISNNSLNGIAIYGSSFNSILKNVVCNSKENGISLRDDSTSNIVTHNEINGNSRYGFNFDESSLNFVQNNEIFDNFNGLVMMHSHNNTLVDNDVHNNAFGMSLEFVQYVVVATNEICNNTQDGLRLVRCGRGKIWENKISQNHVDGIRIVRSDHIIVSDNDINSNGEYGVQVLDRSNHNRFIFNVVNNSDRGGLYIYEGEMNLLSSNAFIDNQNFNVRDNSKNNWLGNFYSDYLGEDLDGNMIGDDPHLIRGHRGTISIDIKPFIHSYWVTN